ncbi:MAG: hypothetical protein FWE32_04995 [Oscillospiraceae bacterium]|nr:hypothetical protein [Oscillospiraceae bacterium]
MAGIAVMISNKEFITFTSVIVVSPQNQPGNCEVFSSGKADARERRQPGPVEKGREGELILEWNDYE